MKKLFILTFSLIFIFCNVNAQLKMDATGSVSIATTPAPSSNIKLRVDLSNLTTSNYAVVGVNTPPTPQAGYYNYGIYGSSSYSTTQTYSQNYGVYGLASNATGGYNYGVFGRLTGNCNGAGVFGAQRNRTAMNTGGNYAGFFNGSVNITDNLTVAHIPSVTSIFVDTLYYNQLIRISDQRLKKKYNNNISCLQ